MMLAQVEMLCRYTARTKSHNNEKKMYYAIKLYILVVYRTEHLECRESKHTNEETEREERGTGVKRGK